MEFIPNLIDWVLHFDEHLKIVVDQYGVWAYSILFLIVFCETGLVVTPFLPGDSLLFVAGTLAAAADDGFNVVVLIPVLITAAVVGDTVNYHVGHYVGPRVFREGRTSRWLKREHLDRTEAFFEKYGGKTIVVARFVPIVRTFAPFVAGMGSMSYPRFLLFNVTGGVLWVVLLVLLGYWFGGLGPVERNFELVILAIIAISLAPPAVEYLRARRERRRARAGSGTDDRV